MEDNSKWTLKQAAKQGLKIKDVWPGRNRFYFGGTCIAGPLSDTCTQCCIYFLMLVIIGLYYGLMMYKLAKDVTVWLPISFSLVAAFTVYLYFLTHCTDPGIVPRKDFLVHGFYREDSYLLDNQEALITGVYRTETNQDPHRPLETANLNRSN